MSDVLVLNASYEPMHRVSWQRAITLVVQNKAVIDEVVPDKWIHYASGQFPWPKILRLVNYVKVPYQYGEVPWTKNGVLKRDKYVCIFCGKHADTVEHLQPVSRYPELARGWMNTAAACFKCNNKKSDRTVEEAGLELLFEPSVPYQLRRIRGSHR
jgi:5-methylcytosine-specific restriction endonuclease McrA